MVQRAKSSALAKQLQKARCTTVLPRENSGPSQGRRVRRTTVALAPHARPHARPQEPRCPLGVPRARDKTVQQCIHLVRECKMLARNRHQFRVAYQLVQQPKRRQNEVCFRGGSFPDNTKERPHARFLASCPVHHEWRGTARSQNRGCKRFNRAPGGLRQGAAPPRCTCPPG